MTLMVKTFLTKSGAPVPGSNLVPFTGADWTLTFNDECTATIRIRMTDQAERWGVREKTRPVKHSVAILDEQDSVAFAGPIKKRSWDGKTLTLNVGDGWTLMKWRLVLNFALKANWVNGEVLIDEKNPPGNWVLRAAGLSQGGLGAFIVKEALRWGEMLLDSPSPAVGTSEETWNCYQFETVYSALQRIAGRVNPPRIRFPSYIDDNGRLRIRYEAAAAYGQTHTLFAPIPGQRVLFDKMDEDSGSVCTQMFGSGGRDDDKLLVARAEDTALEEDGYPLIQAADTSHSSVVWVSTLLDWLKQGVSDGSTKPESMDFKVSADRQIIPGDRLDITVQDPYLGKDTVGVHAVDVSRSVTSEWQTVSVVPRKEY